MNDFSGEKCKEKNTKKESYFAYSEHAKHATLTRDVTCCKH